MRQAPPCKTRREALVTLFPTASQSRQCLHGLSRRSANDNVPICHCHETLCRAGTCPCRCRNYRLRTCLFVCTICRFAVGGDMSPPYRELYDNDRERSPYVIVMKRFVGQGHVPAGVGTTDCVHACSFVPSAASRSAGTCPRPTGSFMTMTGMESWYVGGGSCTGASGMPHATAWKGVPTRDRHVAARIAMTERGAFVCIRWLPP